MADPRSSRRTIGIAQLLLVLAAAALWMAARLPWVVIRSFDGLGPPKEVTLSGASWSTAAATGGDADPGRSGGGARGCGGWPLRVLAGLLAVCSFAVGYLGVSLWVLPGRRGALAQISRMSRS